MDLTLHHRACLGDRAHAYSVAVTIAQEAYLCTGTHDFRDPNALLQTTPIVVERGAFVGALAFVLSGVLIGTGAIVGGCAVVTCDVPADAIVAGNPAHVMGQYS